jgi:hypothetical protein
MLDSIYLAGAAQMRERAETVANRLGNFDTGRRIRVLPLRDEALAGVITEAEDDLYQAMNDLRPE